MAHTLFVFKIKMNMMGKNSWKKMFKFYKKKILKFSNV